MSRASAGASVHALREVVTWCGLAGQEEAVLTDEAFLCATRAALAGRREPQAGSLWEEPGLTPQVESLVFATRAREVAAGRPTAQLARWPRGAPLAVALTHDVDQIHDRGMFRTLADLNHLQKIARGAERGDAWACARRITRSIWKPADAMAAFRRIRGIEAGHGCGSTFFFLEGHEGRRFGARYSLKDPRVQAVARYLMDDGCEIGVHGGYYDLNNSEGYRRSAQALRESFGVGPVGIRNHLLRWTYPATWSAQAAAGYGYDATFGRNELPGFRAGVPWPFQPWDEEAEAAIDLVVLPLTVMDGTLFRRLGLDGAEALTLVNEVARTARRSEGLVTLLWHNNFFAEEEYSAWEETYASTLTDLGELGAWCDRADRIAGWWRKRSRVQATRGRAGESAWEFRVAAPEAVEDIVLRVSLPPGEWSVGVRGAAQRWIVSAGECHVALPTLAAGRPTVVAVSRTCGVACP